MKNGQNQEKIDKNRYFYIKSLTSIPFGGPIGTTPWTLLQGNVRWMIKRPFFIYNRPPKGKER